MSVRQEGEYPFRYVERCLYEYHENVARLAALRERLATLYSTSTAGVQGWDTTGHDSATSDPVATRELRIISLEEEISKLLERTVPITRLMADLSAPYVLQGSLKFELAQVARLFYFGGNERKTIGEKLGMEPRTLYRRRVELVRMAIRYMGR